MYSTACVFTVARNALGAGGLQHSVVCRQAVHLSAPAAAKCLRRCVRIATLWYQFHWTQRMYCTVSCPMLHSGAALLAVISLASSHNAVVQPQCPPEAQDSLVLVLAFQRCISSSQPSCFALSHYCVVGGCWYYLC
jgi:hypothetical protein